MEYLALMTEDFKVIKADSDGVLYAAPLSLQTGLDNIIYLAKQGDGWNLLITQPFRAWFDHDTKSVKRAFPTGNIKPIPLGEGKFCRIQLSDQTFMSVNEVGEVHYDEDEPKSDAALFRLLTPSELQKIYHIVCHKWAIDPLVEIVSVSECENNFHEFVLGDKSVSLDEFFSLNENSSDINEFIFLSGNNIYRAVLFKPVIFLACWGEKAFRQMLVALWSLDDPGDYNGKLLIITDIDSATILAILPKKLQASVEVLSMQAYDNLDYVTIRQTIISSGLVEQYSPVIYMDLDVVINKPLDPMLCEGALIKWFSAQREEWNEGSDFRYTESMGQEFYSQDPYPIDYVECGFNCGVIFLPALWRNKAYMDLCFTSHLIYTTKAGRRVPFPEQQLLNYALRKLHAENSDLVTDLVEIGGDAGSWVVKYYSVMDVKKARGIIHYWCIATDIRPRLMADYLNRLRDYRKTLT